MATDRPIVFESLKVTRIKHFIDGRPTVLEEILLDLDHQIPRLAWLIQ